MLKTVLVGCVASAALYYIKLHFAGKHCTCTTRLDGKTVIVTGANSGIGYEVALELARRGAQVVLACRDSVEAHISCLRITLKTGNPSVRFIHLDLNSFESIKRFTESFKKLDCKLFALVNNAGVFYYPRSLTNNGFDVTFQTNYLGPFLLTRLLLDTLEKSHHSRIVNVSSEAHNIPKTFDITDCLLEKNVDTYCKFLAYGRAKLCLMLFTHKLADVLQSTGVTVNAVDPGNVETNVYRNFPILSNPIFFALQKPLRIIFVKTPWEGAQSVLHALLSPDLGCVSGKYISDCQLKKPSVLAVNQKLEDCLWMASERWCNSYLPYYQ